MLSSSLNVETASRLEQIKKAIYELKKHEVLVGIPQAENEIRGQVTNAELLFIHTNGSPLNKIPPRPVIEPAIEDDKEVITDILKHAITLALDGDQSGAMMKLNEAGLEGQAASQDWFDNPKNGWPENSPYVKRRKIAKGSTEPKPLIDTGELRRAITYVIRRK